MHKWVKRCLIGALVAGIILEGALQVFVKIEERKRAEAPGNSAKYDLVNLEKTEDSPLRDKTILFLGSSVTYGAAAEGQSFVELFEYQDGVDAIKEAKSATTLADEVSPLALLAFGNGESYVSRLKKIDTAQEIDCLVCQLSTNDASLKKKLGEISESCNKEDFDTKTVTGAMEYIIAYAKEKWNCPVVFYTGSYYESSEYAAMVDRLYALKEKWGIGVIDLYTDETFNNIDSEMYKLYMFDQIHPTKAGYELWWMPEIRKQLTEILAGQGD